MKYKFIDVGAHKGDSFLTFMLQDLPAPYTEFGIYLIEPNPKYKKALEELAKKFYNVIVIPEAAWTEDREITFGVDKSPDSLGSTLMTSKNIWNDLEKIEVQAFDFPAWLNFYKEDYLIVKMDIEGAEFPILQKMLDEGTISIINELWCEFHPNKVADYTTTDKLKLIEEIKSQGVTFKEWH